MINLLLKLLGYQIVKSKTLNELRNQLLLSKDPTEYERWFSSVFGVQVPVPGALIATSWSGNDRWGIRANSALLDIEFEYVKELLLEISQRSIEGSIVELGVYNGLWLEKLYELSQSVGFERDIYGFDSFEGLPEPSLICDSTFWKKGMYPGNYEEVKRRLRIAERKRIHLIKGWFKDTLISDEAKGITKISYARIDCDLYESAVECLNYLSSRLTDGAILVFDDWPHRINHGEGKAFAEWLPSVPNLAFEFIFYNTWGHLYLRVHHRANEASYSTPRIKNYPTYPAKFGRKDVLTKYGRVVNRLLPGNTKRRSAYDLALTGVRTIANEGWRSFFRKARVWLKSKIARRQTSSNLRRELEVAGKNEVLLQFMLSHISPGSVIYDVGAYIGLYSILLADGISNSLIYAFEPNPTAFAELVANIRRVGLQERVIALNVALDERCGTRSFNISSEPARSSFYASNATYDKNTVTKSVLVNCHSIDYLVGSGLCKPPDVIKIDTEGNEHRVVFGSKSVIMSKSPKICFEPHGLESENSNTAEPIKEFLSQFGYKFDSLGYPIWCYKPQLDGTNDKNTPKLTNNLHKSK